MNNKEVLDFILEVESSLKKIDVRYERHFLLIRLFLYGEFRSKNKLEKIGIVQKIKHILDDLFDFLKMKKIFHEDRLIVSPENHYRFFLNGVTLSKHVYAIENEIGKALVISIGRNKHVSFSVTGWMSFIFKIKNLFIKDRSREQFLKDFENECVKILKVKEVERKINFSTFNLLIMKFYFYLKFYDFFIPKKPKLKQCIFVAYYNIHSLSMIEVLKKRGVECAEYQHGLQNDCHPMYASLGSVQNSLGMPSVFWGWDCVSKKRIVSELGSQFFKETGNLWYKTEAYKNKVIKLNRPEKSILVALQKWPDFFNFNVLTVMENDKEYLWVFREHPLSKIPLDEKEKIIKCYSNVVFENSNDVSLEDSIQNCSFCFTGFSTVGIEAYNMNKRVVFYHKNALLGLSHYLDLDGINYAEGVEEISSIIYG